jgi:hypothetical protein
MICVHNLGVKTQKMSYFHVITIFFVLKFLGQLYAMASKTRSDKSLNMLAFMATIKCTNL